MKLHIKFSAILISSLIASSTLAAVSADEAKQLGSSTLTLFGAETAGNKEGTIPAYDGSGIKAPAGWNVKKHGYPDPWGEKPLFTITAQNAAQYADKLDAMIEVFKKYPNFRMDIYPSHRPVFFPKAFLDNTVKNATACKGEGEELRLVGCYGGVPFPFPKTGRQEMWNHLLTYTAFATHTDNLQTWVVPPSGSAALQSTLILDTRYNIFDPATMSSPIKPGEIYYKARVEWTGPARQVGNKLLVTYSIDTLGVGNRVWQYIPGQRRVKLAPDLAYDTPSPASGGASTMDDQQGFLGALDRYDFKLIGKKEKFIVYNSFNMTDPRVCPDAKSTSTKFFANPDCIRWELHRVWKVEANLRPGYRHIYTKRIFYWDEDTHGAGAAENYDASGKLYRMLNLLAYPLFEGGSDSQSGYEMDMLTGIYAASGFMGSEGGVWHAVPTAKDERVFSPEALAGEGIR